MLGLMYKYVKQLQVKKQNHQESKSYITSCICMINDLAITFAGLRQ